ncbi:hypothetical protein BH23CHL2_BH23CHL2_20000 [soil metagenome]
MTDQPREARMSIRPDGYESDIRRDRLLWFGVLGAPTAWSVHLGLSYFLVYILCGTGYTWLLHIVTLAMAVVAAAALYVALQQRGVAAERDPERRDDHWDRVQFMGRLGAWMSGLFGAAVIAGGIPIFFLDLCGPVQ